jgi:endoglucanase
MARVREVVQWAYDLDMHIILNSHHDEVGWEFTDANIEQELKIFTRIWEQIAEEFKGYSNRLIFAGLNEPTGTANRWNGGTPETRANINVFNQTFVNTVRASGGNNANRFLVVPTHAASGTNRAFNGFTIPADTANDRLILAIHTYSPFEWAHDGKGTYSGADNIRSDLRAVSAQAERLGVPVVLSEWGSINNGQAGNLDQRVQHAYDYVSIAREFGMATFWWDTNNTSGGQDSHSFGLFDRQTRAIHFPAIVDAIMRAYK